MKKLLVTLGLALVTGCATMPGDTSPHTAPADNPLRNFRHMKLRDYGRTCYLNNRVSSENFCSENYLLK